MSDEISSTARISRRTWDGLDLARRRGAPWDHTCRVGRDTDRGLVFVDCRVVEEYPLFSCGEVVLTRHAATRLEAAGLIPVRAYAQLLARHLGGDWGILPLEDHEENDLALERGYRLFSAYQLYDERYWVITEADRSVTTLLLPEDY